EALDTRRGRVRSIARTRQPDVVAVSFSGKASARILGDEEVASRIEREVVGHAEIRRRVDTNLHVVVHERGRVRRSTSGLAEIDGDDAIVGWTRQTGDCYVQRVDAAAIVARRSGDLDVL